MPKKSQPKTPRGLYKKRRVKITHTPHRHQIKIRYLAVASVVLVASVVGLSSPSNSPKVAAASCPDLKLIFARGSGSPQNTNDNYLTFKSTIETKLAGSGLSYEFEDLTYPAVAVGLNNLLVTLGALIGGGNAYEFGNSVAQGARQMINEVNSATCPNTKYVLAGYSQGAIVIDKVLPSVPSDRIIYAATFGDPKIYLPEGYGTQPAACYGQNLSDYRAYVPDCYTYIGMLGPTLPYRPEALAGRVGTWCNRRDVFCSPYFDIAQHTAYIADNLYEDASRVIYAHIANAFHLGDKVLSPHDTAIMIDSTASMSSLIDQYKQEALRLARETLESGGRVALYDYRDLKDPYQPQERCNFNTCTLERFETELNNIKTGGGGDSSESLLSASLQAMNELKWQYGATKSLVVLTDAGFISPDRDKTTLADVVSASRTIDPVNFYIITTPESAEHYTDLAAQTDGKVVTDLNQLSLLTDYIMDRYDSLPRVEESSEPLALPTLTIDQVDRLSDNSAKISFTTDAPKTLVILNDTPLGITDQSTITFTDLKPEYQNIVTLVPLTDDLRGNPVSATINDGRDIYDLSFASLPKAPNTGKITQK